MTRSERRQTLIERARKASAAERKAERLMPREPDGDDDRVERLFDAHELDVAPPSVRAGFRLEVADEG